VKKKSNRPVSMSTEHVRHATYSQRAVRCKNVDRYGARVSPGMLVWYHYFAVDGSKLECFGRVFAAVTAPVQGVVGDAHYVAPIKNHLAVLEMSSHLGHAHVRWIDPERVTHTRSPLSEGMLTFLLSTRFEDMPVDDMLRLSSRGSLSNAFVGEVNNGEAWCPKCSSLLPMSRKCDKCEVKS
jgi:hypothetical protein